MNYGEAKELFVYKAGDEAGLSERLESIPSAFLMAHEQLQRSLYDGQGVKLTDGNWRDSEASADLTYAATDVDGVDTPEDYKTARTLWLVNADGSRKALTPSTENEANHMRLVAVREPMAPFLDAQNYHQRWYEKELRIALLFPAADAVTLRLDYYRYLPFYTGDLDHDLFTDRWLDVMLAGAMANCVMLDPKLRGAYRQEFERAYYQAWKEDRMLKAGGVQRVRRPPLSSLRR